MKAAAAVVQRSAEQHAAQLQDSEEPESREAREARGGATVRGADCGPHAAKLGEGTRTQR